MQKFIQRKMYKGTRRCSKVDLTTKAWCERNKIVYNLSYWHSSDFAKTTKGSTAHESYYKVGFNFTNSSHDIWNLGSIKSGKSGWNYQYQSTGAAGQTTFLKLTDEWIKANKYKGKW